MMSESWTIGKVVRWATDDFRARGIDSPRLDAELVIAQALGTTRVQLIIDSERPLDPGELGAIRELVKRRRTREPVAYLRGEREFYGRPFRVDRRVLVPRPDTEALIDVAISRTRFCALSMRALDLCTGSGCVGITLAKERPTSRVYCTDLSEDAVAVARENALRLGAYNASVWAGDLFGAIDPGWRFDLITANPPYIPTKTVDTLDADIKDHEPRLALDGGVDGLQVAARIIHEAPAHLASGGVLALEIGDDQGPAVADLLAKRGFGDVRVDKDYARRDRVVSGLWAESRG